jgi:hypothetical protein
MPHSLQLRGCRAPLGGWPVLAAAAAALSSARAAASGGYLAHPRPAAVRRRRVD